MTQETFAEKHIRVSDEETPVLQALAESVPAGGLIIEIGSANGYSCAKIAEACNEDVRIYAIDPWTLAPQKQQPARERKFHQTIAPYKHKIKPIKAFSQDVELKEAIDLLFIDGNHHYQFVSHDYLKFAPLVKKSGVLVFHDYHDPRAPGVTKVIDELVIPTGLWKWRVEHQLWIGVRK